MGDSQVSVSGNDSHGPCPTCPNGKCPTIDTTPTEPMPPDHLIESAKKAIPSILSRVIRDYTAGRYECDALGLANRLCRDRHTPPAATWAIHQLIVEGKLSAHMVPTDVPSVYDENGNRLTGDPHTWIGLPDSGPAPFNAFLVRAEESLWVWWREIDIAPTEGESSNKTPKKRGRKERDPETKQREAQISADWEKARERKISKADFAKGLNMSLKHLNTLLNRVAKNKSRSDKKRRQ